MISFWSSRSGSSSDSRTRSAVSAASCALTTSSSRMANSSPPKRAAVSVARMLVARRSATSRRTSSPAAWPRLSLIVLKSSRSRKMTAMPLLLAAVARDGVAHALDEQRAVGEVGDRVVEGLVGELLLEGLALADVAAVEHDAADGVVVEQVRVQDLELAQRPVAVAQRALEHLGLARRRTRRRRPAGAAGGSSRSGSSRRSKRVPIDVLGRVAEDALDRRALVDDGGVGVEHGDEVAGVLHERAEARLALAAVDLLGQRRALERERDLRGQRRAARSAARCAAHARSPSRR